MTIVVAMDSFKGSLTAPAACAAVARGLRRAQVAAPILLHPLADGGEGTAEVVRTARGGERVELRVTGPLPGMKVDAGYASFGRDGALVEMAQASGLARLSPAELDPLRATTYGTGELLRAAVTTRRERIWLAVGDSATVDGGVGAAMALGWRFLDDLGNPISLGGGELGRIHSLVAPGALDLPPVDVLCDVDHPLCGEHGAARVFGPQKGATTKGVEILERHLDHLAQCVSRELGVELRDLPRGGAAGGLAAGAVAFFGARLVSGVDTIITITGLAERLSAGDWVITGEGRLDEPSLSGKVVSGVIRVARAAGARVAVLAGAVELSRPRLAEAGIAVAEAIRPPGMAHQAALARAGSLLAEAAERFAREHL